MIVLTISAILFATLTVAAVVLVHLMRTDGRSLPVTAEWISDLSTERYKPMLRLLDSADIQFLRSQPGYTRQLEDKLRMQRCKVFHGYLRCLNTDFQRVATALKIVMAQSQQDRPDLASALIHQQVLFASGMLAIYFRLTLYRFGVCNVDVSNLVRIFDGMRVELCALVPSNMAACA
jgi:hypothetical protein